MKNRFYVKIDKDTQSSKFILEVGNEYDAFRVPQSLPELVGLKNKLDAIIEEEREKENEIIHKRRIKALQGKA